MNPVQWVLVVSLLANAWLVTSWLGARDEATRMTEQRDEARANASACSDGVEDLRTLADERQRTAAAAIARARAQARPHELRADLILVTPATEPGDDCRSALERGRAWLAQRGGQ